MSTSSNTKFNEDLPQKWEDKLDENLEEKLKDRDQKLIAIMDQKFEEHVKKLEGELKILDKMETFFNIEDSTKNSMQN